MMCSFVKNLFRCIVYSSLITLALITYLVKYEKEYVGIRYLVIKQSIKNIFYPTTFEDFKPYLKFASYVKLSRWNNHTIIEIIDDAFSFEYHYWCKYKYVDKNGNIGVNIDHVIHNWKPWEYYYLEYDKNFLTEEHKKAMTLRQEWIDNYRNMEIEKYRRYQTN